MGSGSSRPSEGSPPEAMAGLEGVNVKRVASTAFHGLAVSNLGVVYSFGDGKSGRLGHGDEEGLMVPQPVAALQGERVSAIAAGGEHSLVVTTHGQVFSFGSGSFGQLGHGDLQQQLTPHLVAALAGVRVLAVQAGALHSLALSDHGAVFSWGLGAQGQLGHDEAGEPEPSKRRRKAPTGAVSRLPSPPSERPRKLTATPTAIQNLPERGRVTAIAAGGFHSLAMTDRGAVYSFGHGMHGQLGHGDTSDQPTPRLIDGLPERGRVVAVAAGAHHSLAVSDRGAIYSFGYGGHGQLGHGDRADQLLPQPVAALEAVRIKAAAGGADHSLALDNFGVLYSFGLDEPPPPRRAQPTPRIVEEVRVVRVADACDSFAAGSFARLAVASGGATFSWGTIKAPDDHDSYPAPVPPRATRSRSIGSRSSPAVLQR